MTETHIPADEHSYRMSVLESLTRLETLAKATADHLARLNGSVARHEERLQHLQQACCEHQTHCPIGQDVQTLKAAVLADETEARAASVWWGRLAPALWLGIGGVIVLFLVHANELLRAFSKP